MRRRAATLIVMSSYVSAGINAISGFVFVPWYLATFGLATYGAWLASGNILALLGLLDGAVNQVAGQRLAETYGGGDRQAFARLAGAVLVLGFATLAVLTLGLAGGATLIVSRLDFEGVDMPGLVMATLLAGIGGALAFLQVNLATFPLAWQRPMVPSLGVVAGQIASLAVIAGGLWSGFGVVALGAGALTRGLVATLVTACAVVYDWRVLGLPRPTLARGDVGAVLRSSLPMTGARFVSVLLNHSESALVALLLGSTAAGVLALTSRLYQLGGMLVQPIAGAASSGLAHLFGSGDRQRLREVVRELLQTSSALAALFFVPVLAVNASVIAVWVGSDRYAGLTVDALVLLSLLLSVRNGLVQVAVVAVGQYSLSLACSILELAVRLGVVFALAHVIGLAAVPLATVVSALVALVFVTLRGSGVLTWRGLVMTGSATLLVSVVCAAAMRLGLAYVTLDLASWPRVIAFGAVVGVVALAATYVTSPVLRARLRLA